MHWRPKRAGRLRPTWTPSPTRALRLAVNGRHTSRRISFTPCQLPVSFAPWTSCPPQPSQLSPSHYSCRHGLKMMTRTGCASAARCLPRLQASCNILPRACAFVVAPLISQQPLTQTWKSARQLPPMLFLPWLVRAPPAPMERHCRRRSPLRSTSWQTASPRVRAESAHFHLWPSPWLTTMLPLTTMPLTWRSLPWWATSACRRPLTD
mmetsp:Transcript_26350/g.79981  ORF Transcript_26350/g.79981 Transcript_26350/m.79981 type:complete len:208 (-) Transcript_26350:1981-2604(-)